MVNQTNFRIALIRAGLSQTDLAIKVRLHPTTLTGIVRGWYKVKPFQMRNIVAALGVSEDDIFSSEPPRTGREHE